MSITLVQTVHAAHAGFGGGSLNQLTLPSAVGAGNLLIIGISCDSVGGAPVTDVTDSLGNTWTQMPDGGPDTFDAADDQSFSWWYATGVAAGATTVTLVSADLESQTAVLAEFHSTVGTLTRDTSDSTPAVAASTTGADAAASDAIVPAASGELIVAVYNDGAGNTPTVTAGTGYTLVAAEPGTSGITGATAMAYKIGGSGSTVATFTVNQTGNNYAVFIAAFTDSGGGGGSTHTVVEQDAQVFVCATTNPVVYTPGPPPDGWANVTLPAISGSSTVGGVASAAPGTWSPSAQTVAYQWFRANPDGSQKTLIPGATGRTYVSQQADAGQVLIVDVTVLS